jgi:transposase
LGLRARIVTLSWPGLPVPQVAEQAGCHPRTVRHWLHRFNADGVPGLGDRGGRDRPRRISEQQRSQIVALGKTIPPGRLRYDRAADALVQADGACTAGVWTLDALTEAANAMGIDVGRSMCVGFCLPTEPGGGRCGPGRFPRTLNLSQKDSRHRRVHPHAEAITVSASTNSAP